ncbi:hypothetical protein SCA03_03360 [Streptomyces cacaoi]|uniref:Uncharacterized protein n=1 Tax=Streptomyces cacaoi TaxID=1898 RepID=A0A4Y3QR57_STRCI|nr:hypothetical protein SCA03_03360 [Streptomyces cacaoi]
MSPAAPATAAASTLRLFTPVMPFLSCFPRPARHRLRSTGLWAQPRPPEKRAERTGRDTTPAARRRPPARSRRPARMCRGAGTVTLDAMHLFFL